MKYKSFLIKFVQALFLILVMLSLLSPLWTFSDLLFPYVTSKAFYFRIAIEAAFPLYVFLIARVAELRPKWKKHPINVLVLLFLVFNILSSFAGVGVIRSLWGNFERMGGAFYLAHLVALYFYVLAIGEMGGSYLKSFLNGFLVVALLITINGIFGKLGWPTLVIDPSLPNRVSSTLGNPIYLGSYLVIPIFLALFFASQSDALWKKSFYYFSSFLFMVGLILSGTRGALIGLLAGSFIAAVVYISLTSKKNVRLYGGILVVGLVLCYLVLSMFSAKLPTSMQRLFRLKDSNTEARLIQWGVALRGYRDYPIFGVGPENYYVIANKYYNPEIFQYDRSWFDKPHNYIVEILVTTGIFGFLAYVGILVALIWAMYKSYRAGFLSLFEFCALLGGLLAYQGQNLTVFDTVPASLAFYSFIGFIGYILQASITVAKPEAQNLPTKIKIDQTFSFVAGGLSLLVMAYTIYVTNIVPMEVSYYVNYGFAYGSVDPLKADAYFQQAMALPFNFDKTQSAEKYAEFANSLSRQGNPTYQDLAQKVNGEATQSLKDALVYEPQYPVLWQDLAIAQLLKNYQNGAVANVDPAAFDSANQGIALAPQREEGYLTLAQVKGITGDLSGAGDILNQLQQKFPTDWVSKIQLATIYRLQNHIPEAADLTTKAIKLGYSFSSYNEIRWLVSYDVTNKNFTQANELLKQAQQIDSNNVTVYEDQAVVYASTGQVDLARSLALAVMQASSSTAPEMQALLNSLPGGSAPATGPVK